MMRMTGIALYFILSGIALYGGFVLDADWAPVAGGGAAMLFGASAATDRARRVPPVVLRLFSISFAAAATLTVFKVFPMQVLIMFLAAGMAWFAYELRGGGSWLRGRAATALFAAACLLFLPVPGVHKPVPSAPSDYSTSGEAGRILAPNVKSRAVAAAEWLARSWTEASAAGMAPEEAARTGAPLASPEASEDFAALYSLPFEVPPALYRTEGAATDPHALMKLLARWNDAVEGDVTQGQTVMGIGTVAADGSIGMVEPFEAYVEAASLAKPKALFVPVDGYLRARSVDKELLVVPVARFEEMLYFLNEPVMFWPLRNFGLFCH